MEELKTRIEKTLSVLKSVNKLELSEVELRGVKEDEVLIEVHYSSINAEDYFFCRDDVHTEDTLFPCGTTGSGIIQQVGQSLSKSQYLHQIVAFYLPKQGTWTQYLILPIKYICVINEPVLSMREACLVYAFPLAAMAFIFQIQNKGHMGFVQSNPTSILGKTLIKVCKKKGITVINIAQNEKEVKDLYKIGAKYVLNAESPEFLAQLKQISGKLEIEIFFDCIGGDLSSSILDVMPNKSILYCYAGLRNQSLQNINPKTLILSQKAIKGWNLSNSFIFNEEAILDDILQFILNDIRSEGELFSCKTENILELTSVPDYLNKSKTKKHDSDPEDIVLIKICAQDS